MSSEYERLRLKNIEDNKRVLAELGLLNPFNPLPRVIKRAPKRKRDSEPSQPKKKPVLTTVQTENNEDYGSIRGSRRRSARMQGKPAPEEREILGTIQLEVEQDEKPVLRAPKDRPKVYGRIPDVPVGRWWQTRIECNIDGIHRPTVAGIHAGPEGAYSIALSGGYEDDIDLGECFTYTGEGGRDLKGTKNNPKNLRTAPQSKDQCLSRGNESLVKSHETQIPIRVIRGYKSDSAFAPEEGYRYDGLYKVEKYWYTTGMAGFGVYKFALRRLVDQPPPPWTLEGQEDQADITESQSEGEESELDGDLVDKENQEPPKKRQKTDELLDDNQNIITTDDEKENVDPKEIACLPQHDVTEVKPEAEGHVDEDNKEISTEVPATADNKEIKVEVPVSADSKELSAEVLASVENKEIKVETPVSADSKELSTEVLASTDKKLPELDNSLDEQPKKAGTKKGAKTAKAPAAVGGSPKFTEIKKKRQPSISDWVIKSPK